MFTSPAFFLSPGVGRPSPFPLLLCIAASSLEISKPFDAFENKYTSKCPRNYKQECLMKTLGILERNYHASVSRKQLFTRNVTEIAETVSIYFLENSGHASVYASKYMYVVCSMSLCRLHHWRYLSASSTSSALSCTYSEAMATVCAWQVPARDFQIPHVWSVKYEHFGSHYG